MQLGKLVLEGLEVFTTLCLAVVVSMKHEGVVKIHEEGCLGLTKEERNVDHLKLFSNLKVIVVLGTCIRWKVRLEVEHDSLVKQIGGYNHRGTRSAVPCVAGVEDWASLFILAESKEGSLIGKRVASLCLVDLRKDLSLNEPLSKEKSGATRQNVEPLANRLAWFDLLLREESLQSMLGKPVESIRATKAARVHLEHRFVIPN
mmetsp:Transcript_40667/g.101710  ORF Transcript_40667/g.101710 Transcript_40667/m.101710 type:complete len:203 (-) Transcript_40667:419-1027(-)